MLFCKNMICDFDYDLQANKYLINFKITHCLNVLPALYNEEFNLSYTCILITLNKRVLIIILY